MGLLLDYGIHVMLVGKNGAGKSAIVNDRVRTVCSGEVAEVQALTVHTNKYVINMSNLFLLVLKFVALFSFSPDLTT